MVKRFFCCVKSAGDVETNKFALNAVYNIKPTLFLLASNGDVSIPLAITSGTILSNHKLPIQTYLFAIALFLNVVKGISTANFLVIWMYSTK